MTNNWAVKMVEIGVILAIVLAGFGHAVLQLWNLLVPGIFGLRQITYWEALGLLALSWILFGGLRGFGIVGGHRRSGLTREERAQLHQRLSKD
jgi:hypothetical protein